MDLRQKSVSGRLYRLMLDAAERQGLDRAKIIRNIGIDEADIAASDARVSGDKHVMMLKLAETCMSRGGPPEGDVLVYLLSFPELAGVVCNSPTLRDALRKYVAYRDLIGTRLPEFWIHGVELPQQLVDRRIGEPAAIMDIFHVTLAVGIELVKQRVAFAVEDQLPDAEPFAHLGVERRRDLELPAVEPQRDVTMIDEQVGSHQLGELRRIEVIADIGKSDRRGNAGAAQRSRQQDRLRHAIIRRLYRDPAGAVVVRAGADIERIVSDAVAHRIEQPDRLAGLRQVARTIQAA